MIIQLRSGGMGPYLIPIFLPGNVTIVRTNTPSFFIYIKISMICVCQNGTQYSLWHLVNTAL